MGTPAGPPYNQVVKIPLEFRWYRGPRASRYMATYYHSGYGMGCVTAFTRRKCEERYKRLAAEFMLEHIFDAPEHIFDAPTSFPEVRVRPAPRLSDQ